jgi:hypothetical protein
MSRLLTLLAALLVITAAFFMVRDRNRTVKSPTIEPTINTTSAPQASAEPNNFHDWRVFTSDQGHFKVLLPTLPQHVSDVVVDQKSQEPRKYETYASASDNGAAFMVNAITFTNQNGVSDEEALKSAVTDMLARNKENKLVEMKMGSFLNSPALDFSLSNGDLLIIGKVLARDKTMYILSMINNKDNYNQKELDFFLNSFEIVKTADQHKSESSKSIDTKVELIESEK